jgi:uncharacterized protein (TIGR01777 family)
MKILVSGSTGLVGTHLVKYLSDKGHIVSRLVRNSPQKSISDIYWNPSNNAFEFNLPLDFDAVIHLAGENIASGLWTNKKKAKIRDSRINSTEILARSIAQLTGQKPVFLCASATGYYGNCGNEILSEESPAGTGFLAEVVRDWENASVPAMHAGVRVVNIRSGIVLSNEGGILGRLRPVFKLGLGGKLGSGRQYLPWISIQDLVRIFEFALNNKKIEGPLNAVAPEMITNKDFTVKLAEILSRPSVFSVPEFILKTFLGEMADELFLNSARVEPKLLIDSGFEYKTPTLDLALASILN